MESQNLYEQVNKRYGSMNKSKTGQYEKTVATAFGYSEEELSGIPEGANLGLSCGNPLALAKLQEGETVIDLGSGAGFDVFIGAKGVGISGKAIGIDMNKNMIEKANANKAKLANAENITFIQAAITAIPLPSNTANCIISNCVINLVPTPADKQLVFHEIFRLLKPGGRVAISDTLAKKVMTDEMKRDIALYLGCISGASLVSEYEDFLRKAGFKDVLIVDSKNDLNVYLSAPDEQSGCGASDEVKVPTCCSTGNQNERMNREVELESGDGKASMAELAQKMAASSTGVTDFNEWAGSFQIYALKPAE